jgi:two-component sensor histidine kinase
VLVLHDVTEERRARSQLEKTLEHRELLFREIHHRIKNSLQTVSSFVRLQSPDDAPESEREALDSIAAQVDSIAMVHERLYQGSEFGTVDFGQFIEEIVEKLVQFMRPDGSVRAQTDVAHAQFNLKTSTPLGLAVSELVTNALRHGFSDRGGTLLVRLEDQGDSRFRLLVEDDGAGIPEGLAREPESSHGLRIVAALAEQVRGTLSIRNRTPGTGAEIAFEYR